MITLYTWVMRESITAYHKKLWSGHYVSFEQLYKYITAAWVGGTKPAKSDWTHKVSLDSEHSFQQINGFLFLNLLRGRVLRLLLFFLILTCYFVHCETVEGYNSVIHVQYYINNTINKYMLRPLHTLLEQQQRWALPPVPFLRRAQSTYQDVGCYSPAAPENTHRSYLNQHTIFMTFSRVLSDPVLSHYLAKRCSVIQD